MRVLVTCGSKRGGTEGIGRMLGQALEAAGFEVVASPVAKLRTLDGFGAVIVGGALYANRWPGSARRFVNRHVAQLRKVPVWFFSSGPLDDSADRAEIPATPQVSVLAERIGAQGHVTFGGRLEATARGFAASAMAKTNSGDWRNQERIRRWADELARRIPEARPATAVDHPARSISRLVSHGAVGWALCAATMGTATHSRVLDGRSDDLRSRRGERRARTQPYDLREHRRHMVAARADLPRHLVDGSADVDHAVDERNR